MTFTDVLPILFAVVAAAMLWLIIADHWDERRLAKCFSKIETTECPRCKKILGDTVASTAKQILTRDGSSEPRAADHPPRVVAVNCPHCSVELQFRLDGRLFACDKIVAS
jgi:hypothetical protein